MCSQKRMTPIKLIRGKEGGGERIKQRRHCLRHCLYCGRFVAAGSHYDYCHCVCLLKGRPDLFGLPAPQAAPGLLNKKK